MKKSRKVKTLSIILSISMLLFFVATPTYAKNIDTENMDKSFKTHEQMVEENDIEVEKSLKKLDKTIETDNKNDISAQGSVIGNDVVLEYTTMGAFGGSATPVFGSYTSNIGSNPDRAEAYASIFAAGSAQAWAYNGARVTFDSTGTKQNATVIFDGKLIGMLIDNVAGIPGVKITGVVRDSTLGINIAEHTILDESNRTKTYNWDFTQGKQVYFTPGHTYYLYLRIDATASINPSSASVGSCFEYAGTDTANTNALQYHSIKIDF